MNKLIIIFLGLYLLINNYCGLGVIFEKPSELNPCDPVSNIYDGGKHYIERDFVKEDGTMDFNKWFEARKVQSSPCDPLHKSKSRIKKGTYHHTRKTECHT